MDIFSNEIRLKYSVKVKVKTSEWPTISQPSPLLFPELHNIAMHHRVCLYISRYIPVSPRAGPTAAVARCPGARCCSGPSSVAAGDSHREHVTRALETPPGAQVRVAGVVTVRCSGFYTTSFTRFASRKMLQNCNGRRITINRHVSNV